MPEYIMNIKLNFDIMVSTEADDEQEAVEISKSYVDDYQVVFDDELFPFSSYEIDSIERVK